MDDALPEIPLGFCRAALYLILRKTSRKGKAVKNWDESLVRNLLKM